MTGASNTTGRWDYHVEHLRGVPTVEALNALGAERWELAGTTTQTDGTTILIFKRPAPTLAEQITIDQRTRVQHEKEAGA
ncbi:MAG: hypothetical protein WBA46_17935 [Thermomicrobiales bacterium]